MLVIDQPTLGKWEFLADVTDVFLEKEKGLLDNSC